MLSLFLLLGLQGSAELDAPLPMPETVVSFACEDGTRLTARFRPQLRQVTVDGAAAPLASTQPTTDAGFDYAGGGNRLKGRAAIVQWTAAGRPATACRRVSG